MHVLVTGASGLLGSSVLAEALDRGIEATGTYHSTPPALGGKSAELDLQDTGRFASLLERFGPDAVVNCAAVTDVDRCEFEPGVAKAVNGDAPGAMAAACAKRGCDFLQVSTDYVFDGKSRAPYAEDDPTGPRQVYGETKLAGERAVRDAHEGATVVRGSFLYGVHRGRDELVGFPAWVRDRVAGGESLPLFVDQYVTPSRVGPLAATMLSLLEAGARGTYHVACRDCVTPRAFGAAVCRRAGGDESLLTEGSMADVDRAATRPKNTCLDVSRTEEELGEEMPTLSADLDALEPRLADRPE